MTIPPHPGLLEPLADDVFASGLDDTAADEEALASVTPITHAFGVVAKIPGCLLYRLARVFAACAQSGKFLNHAFSSAGAKKLFAGARHLDIPHANCQTVADGIQVGEVGEAAGLKAGVVAERAGEARRWLPTARVDRYRNTFAPRRIRRPGLREGKIR